MKKQNSNRLEYIADEKDEGKALKEVAKKKLLLSNRLFNKLKLNHHIYINNKIAYANDIINFKDKISVDLDYDEEDNIKAQNLNIKVLYEDDWYIAVDKPANMVVHPCSYHPDNTLANYIKYYLKNSKKIRPVNRLDNGTSGIVLFAKNEYAQERFKYIKKEDVKKYYLAIVEGVLEDKEGTINLPISRKDNSIIEREINFDNGQRAVTHYKVLKEMKIDDKDCSIVEILLETGRTHQIRVHFAYIGHPLIGDSLYNDNFKEQKDNCHQELIAYKLEFKHPITNEIVSIVSKFTFDNNAT